MKGARLQLTPVSWTYRHLALRNQTNSGKKQGQTSLADFAPCEMYPLWTKTEASALVHHGKVTFLSSAKHHLAFGKKYPEARKSFGEEK